MSNDNRNIQKLSEVMNRGKAEFNEDLPRITKDELIGTNFAIIQAKLVPDWESEFGTSDFYLLKIRLDDGREFKIAMGGKALLRQLSKLTRDRKLPVHVSMNKLPGAYGDYFVLQDPIAYSEDIFPEEKPAPSVAAESAG